MVILVILSQDSKIIKIKKNVYYGYYIIWEYFYIYEKAILLPFRPEVA